MAASRANFPYHRATAVYVLALALIGAAVLIGYVFVSGLNQRTADDAALVNGAGRQRMLAQRIARLSLALQAASPESKADRVGELRETLLRWRTGHEVFVRGEAARIAPLRFPASAERYAALESAFLAIETATERLLSSVRDPSTQPTTKQSDMEGLGASCDAYVDEMEALLASLQSESEAHVRDVAFALKGIVVGAVLLLGAEGWFLFRPLLRSLGASYGALDEAHRETQRELEARLEAERERDALRGLLPICSGCKKIRDEHGAWQHIEKYIEERSEARFSHGLCRECIRRLYPDHAERILAELSLPDEQGAT
jgi:nitrate/nitrite-specific signal transduction histidine kinase